MIREKIREYKVSHLLQTLLLLFSMGLVFVLTGWIIAGGTGVKFAVVLAVMAFFLSPRFSFHFYLNSLGARRLRPEQAPRLFEITRRLAERAGLSRVPDLYHLSGNAMNAFAVGGPERAAIGLTHGLLRRLDTREVAGIIGHEITHIKNNDTGIMGLAGLVNRLTAYFSLLGQLLLILFLPALLLGRVHIPLVEILFLVFAPTIATLLQLALSRTREFEADLGSALLTGDPGGFASALMKLEEQKGNLWKRLMVPGWGRAPSFMLTHPPTKERIERLLSVVAKMPEPVVRNSFPLDAGFVPSRMPVGIPLVRRRLSGMPFRYSRYI